MTDPINPTALHEFPYSPEICNPPITSAAFLIKEIEFAERQLRDAKFIKAANRMKAVIEKCSSYHLPCPTVRYCAGDGWLIGEVPNGWRYWKGYDYRGEKRFLSPLFSNPQDAYVNLCNNPFRNEPFIND